MRDSDPLPGREHELPLGPEGSAQSWAGRAAGLPILTWGLSLEKSPSEPICLAETPVALTAVPCMALEETSCKLHVGGARV